MSDPSQPTTFWFGTSVWDQLAITTHDYSQVAVITDTNVYGYYHANLDSLVSRRMADQQQTLVYQIPAGESSKTYRWTQLLTDWLLSHGYQRDCCLVALGGGVVGDLTGFVASIYLRGVPYLQVPTSLLAMVDSSVGGKTAIDTNYGKNTVGSFYFARHVLTATDFLATLPREEWSNGMAEVIKIALVTDVEFWHWLTDFNLTLISDQSPQSQQLLTHIVRTSQHLKQQLVIADAKEAATGSRQWLNFGHTVGHAIELATGLKHGYAVSIGMVQEMYTHELMLGVDHPLAKQQQKLRYQVIGVLTQYGLPTKLPQFDLSEAMRYLARDKKSGRLVTVTTAGTAEVIKIQGDHLWQQFLSPARWFSVEKKIQDETRDSFLPVVVPGSKSETNRAILLAALCPTGTQTKITNLLLAEDTYWMIQALEALGVTVRQETDSVTVVGAIDPDGTWKPCRSLPDTVSIYLGDSGTCARFLLPVLAWITPVTVILSGTPRLTERPLRPLIQQLREVGARLQGDSLPLTIQPTRLTTTTEPLRFTFTSNTASSQFVSGVCLAAPLLRRTTQIIIPTSLVSQQFVTLTTRVMAEFGNTPSVTHADSESNTVCYTVSSESYTSPHLYHVTVDATSLVYPMALASITGTSIQIPRTVQETVQGDVRYSISLFEKLGGKVQQEGDFLHYQPPKTWPTNWGAINFDSSDTFNAWASLAIAMGSELKITGIGNQNVKECQRILATFRYLQQLAPGQCQLLPDGLWIKPRSDTTRRSSAPTMVATYRDHRMAMSASLLATVSQGPLGVDNIHCVEKTYPAYVSVLSQFGIGRSESVV